MEKIEKKIRKALAYLRILDRTRFKLNFKVAVLGAVFLVLLYLLFVQSDRYLSMTKVIVDQSRPMEAAGGNFGSMGIQRNKSEDSRLIIEYIKSVEMVEYLDYSIDMRKIYSSKRADFFSRLSPNADKGELHKFYLDHISVKLNPESSILQIEVQAFSPEDSRRILELVIKRSEEFINKIFHDVAKGQLDFIKNEVLAKEKRILELEKKIRSDERKAQSSDSKIMGNSTRRKLEFAIQAHKSSLESLENVRAESAQNLKKLIVITGPTMENEASYPRRTYNIILFLSIFGLVYFIARSTYATVVTHRTGKH